MDLIYCYYDLLRSVVVLHQRADDSNSGRRIVRSYYLNASMAWQELETLDEVVGQVPVGRA